MLCLFFLCFTVFGEQRRLRNNTLGAQAFERAYKLVARAETYRMCGGGSCSYSIELMHTDMEEQQFSARLAFHQQVLLNEATARMQQRTLMKLQKHGNADAALLGKDLALWFYKTGTAHAFRISPAQTLLGHVAYAELMYRDYLRSYEPVALEHIFIGEAPLHKVVLEKVEPAAVYSSIVLYIADDEYNKPVKAELYNEQALRKTLHFLSEHSHDSTRLQTWRVVDAKEAGFTIIRFGARKRLTLPSSAFTSEGLKGL